MLISNRKTYESINPTGKKNIWLNLEYSYVVVVVAKLLINLV